jgi:hypothetical protein
MVASTRNYGSETKLNFGCLPGLPNLETKMSHRLRWLFSFLAQKTGGEPVPGLGF